MAPRFILAASALILHVIAALSGRLFIASVVIAVRKRAVSMSEALPYKLAYKPPLRYKPPPAYNPPPSKGLLSRHFLEYKPPLKYIILTKIKLFLNRNYTISTTILLSISTTLSSSSIGIADASFSTSSGVKLLCNSSESPLSLGRQSF
jgi:hypothetical protein